MKKSQEGITLIALVITIIVMLILVIVTINVATSGGLFDSARNASKDTTKRAEEEELIGYIYDTNGDVYSASTGKVNLNTLQSKLPDTSWITSGTASDGETALGVSGNQLTIENKKSGNIHIIDGSGKIVEITTGKSLDNVSDKDTWTNVGIAATIDKPDETISYWCLCLHNNEGEMNGMIEYDPEDYGIISFYCEASSAEFFMYSWENQNYEFEADDGTSYSLPLTKGWNGMNKNEKGEFYITDSGSSDIEKIRLNVTVRTTDGEKTWNFPNECAKWFLQY